ncbi:MAG: hypothetical protein HY329_22065, partial [Chloroflexi bacterium]|nr:hypothetical protein [Chloroflexota bacterium]
MVGQGRLIGRNLLRLWMALVITALLLPLVPSQPNRPVGQPDIVEAQGVNDPQLLVSSGVTSFSVVLARVLWLSLPGCPLPGPVDPRGSPQPPAELGAPVQTGEGSLPAVAESVVPAEPAVDEPGRITPAQAGAPVVIRRTDTRGIFGFRVLFERNDPRAAGVCNPYQVRSNLISDGTNVYWVDASGLVRLSLEASPDQAPERVTAEVGGPKAGGQVTNVQLVMTDDSIYAITTETTRARLDRVLKANGRTSTEALIRGTPVALKTNGVFIHWIEARTLYRHRIGETGVVGAIANDVTNYAPGPGQYLYFGRNQQIWVYDYGLALVGQGPLYTGALPTHRVIDIVQDRNNLYFFEAQCSNPQGCLAPERFLLFRRGKAANARTEVLANLSARAVPPRNLHVTLEFLLWQDNDRIVRLPKDVAAVPQINMRATRMLVTQGIQQRDNSIRLIQDRRTFVRVFAQADGPPVAGITATLFATFNNGRSNEALTRPINPAGPAITVPSAENRDDINASFLFELPWNWTRQSDLVLRAVINSNNWPLEPSRADNLITLGPIRFEPSPRLQVRFIRYGYPLMGELPVASLADYDNALSWIRRSFPLASRPAAYNSRERGLATTEFFRADVDLGEQVQYPLPCPMDAAGNANCDNLRASGYVNSQIEAERAEFGDEAGTRYYSMIPRHTMFFPRGQAATVASSGPVPDAGDYAAHEIAHTLGRPHPTPGSMACGHSASDNNYPYANAAIGDAQDEGFDPGNPVFGGTPSIRPSSGWFDIMGYCSPLWISDYTYNALFDSIANNDALNVGAAATARVAGDWLMAYGVITPSANQATFHRLRRVPEVAQVPNRVPGDYSLQLLDAQNAVVADYPFTPKTLEDADPPMLQFGEVVSFVPGATQVRISRLADQRVVATRPVSTNPPTVGSVRLDPSPAGPVSGTVTLRWDAADPDGDALKFDVLYSRDGGTRFDPLQLNLTTREAQVDTARLGGGNAIFRVVATDGVNSARADTPPFMMANKPPVPKILSPADGSRFRFEQNINLLGTAEDFQDGTVPDAMLVWSSQRGRIGTGSMISSTSFPPGPNEITLTATNRDGLSASTKIMIVVSDDVELPNPTLSAGPTDINWHVAAGTTQLQTAMVQVTNPGTGALSYTATSDQPWLTVTPASGTAPGQLTLAANPAGLPSPSVNTATVQLRAPGVEGAPEQMVNVRVRLTVGDVFSTPPGTSPSTAPPAPTPPAGGMMVYIPTARNAVADPTFGGTWRTGLQVFNRDLSKPAVVQIRYYRPDGTQAAVTT